MNDGIVGAPVGHTPVSLIWRAFFWAASVFNLVIGLAQMLSPIASQEGRLVGLLVFSFGVVFVLVARDPARYGSALWGGFICKVGLVAMLAPAQFAAEGKAVLTGILALDAIFAAGFLWFLLGRNNED